jgi:hypothetical protein
LRRRKSKTKLVWWVRGTSGKRRQGAKDRNSINNTSSKSRSRSGRSTCMRTHFIKGSTTRRQTCRR